MKQRNHKPVTIKEAIAFRFVLDGVKWAKMDNPHFGRAELTRVIQKVAQDYQVDPQILERMFIWKPCPPPPEGR